MENSEFKEHNTCPKEQEITNIEPIENSIPENSMTHEQSLACLLRMRNMAEQMEIEALRINENLKRAKKRNDNTDDTQE